MDKEQIQLIVILSCIPFVFDAMKWIHNAGFEAGKQSMMKAALDYEESKNG